jgi:UDPglucose 6-dehydrogenase
MNEKNLTIIPNKKVLVLGALGYVGRASVELFKRRYEIDAYDPKTPRYDFRSATEIMHLREEQLREEQKEFINYLCEFPTKGDYALCAICVPTPAKEDGSCDLSYMEDVFSRIKMSGLNIGVIVIKSTVPVGTTDRFLAETGLPIVHFPEFIGESRYYSPYDWEKEMVKAPWYILGGDKKDCSKVIDILAPICGPCKSYNTTDAKTSELVKLWENSFYASKVCLMNEIFEICDATGVDFHELRRLWALDPRISIHHTLVFKDNRGFGSKCYLKDLLDLIDTSEKHGYEPKLLKQVVESNKYFRSKNKVQIDVEK